MANRRRLRPWMFVSAAWLIVAALATIREIVNRRINNETWSVHDIIFAGAGDWLTLALLTPAVFAVSSRWPIAAPRVGRRLLLHLGLALVFWTVVSVFYQGVFTGIFNPHATQGDLSALDVVTRLANRSISWALSTLPPGVAVYASSVGIEHAIRYFLALRDRDLQVARLAEQLSTARFAALQAQLNPHFLFNTLNTIAVRARDGDGPGTARMVERLSEVLRRTLDRHRANEVTVEEEIELVREYLAIEQARFSDRLRPVFDIDASALAATLPSFSVQHLVENAIRHGISRQPGSGALRIDVRRRGDTLEVLVIDDGAGIDTVTSPRTGHGLENTRQRLAALYGDEATLEVARGTNGGTVATLRLPFREAALEASVA